MFIEIINRQSDVQLDSFKPIVEAAVSAALELENLSCDYLCIQFLSDSTMRRYHLKYFNDGSSTDCMSFPMDMEEEKMKGNTTSTPQHLGEILVCPKTAIRYLKSTKSEKNSLYEEIALYVIHGMLHLMGYDDITEKQRRLMRKKEKEAFAILQKNYPKN